MAGILAVIALPVAFASNVLLLMPFGFDLAAASDPVEALNLRADQSSMLRWGLILDLFGYYLLLVPLTLALRQWTRRETSLWMALATVCGVAYLIIGAMGAAGLTAAVPPLIDQYGLATSEMRSAIEVGYALINDFVVQAAAQTATMGVNGTNARTHSQSIPRTGKNRPKSPSAERPANDPENPHCQPTSQLHSQVLEPHAPATSCTQQ